MDIDDFEAMEQEAAQAEAAKATPAEPGVVVPEPEYVPVAFEDEPAPIVEEKPVEPAAPVTPEVPAAPPEAVPATPATPVQPDVNAVNAQRRREQETKDKIEAERQKWLTESPEAQLARELGNTYNLPPAQILEQIREGKLQKEATATGVPIENLRRREAEKQESVQNATELAQLKGEIWSNRVLAETTAIQGRYPVLTDQDLLQAAEYMVKTLNNPDLPIEHVTRILFSGKMQEHDMKTMEQEILAKNSGRAGGALPPQGSPTTTVAPTLSAAEKTVAAKMGMSEAEYLRFKV